MVSKPRQPTAAVANLAAAPPVTGRPTARSRELLAGIVLVIMVLVTYVPVLSAGFIWDDEENVVTNRTLRSLDGLRQMWTVPRSIQQYYPLMYTSYWLEYHAWGLAPLGYHVVNILLHATATLLVWRLLVRLRVPGAWLAAALFAVHPVMVESVAWVTERKNVLSLSLALVSLLAYFRFAPPEEEEAASAGAARWHWYALSLLLFALALTAKTVVVTLPPVLLVIAWWKRGRVTSRDLAQVGPFFALAVAMGIMTMFMETVHLGAHGKEWSLTPLERLLLAGRAVWFYAGKLVWPWPLAFFYPRFAINAHQWWQYLFPLAAIAVPVALWRARNRIGRGPLAAVLIYVGVLLPMLGFFNIYFALYAQVSDHFQYHASVALFALAAAAATGWAARLSPQARNVAQGLAVVLLAGLAAISFRQESIYHDLETLYRDTIAKNPQGTIAYSNLGVYLGSLGRHEESIELTRAALALDPTDPIAHTNLGYFLLNLGYRDGFQSEQLAEAIAHLRQGLSLAQETWGSVPGEARLRTQLAGALLRQGARDGFTAQQLDEANAQLNQALHVDPQYSDAEAQLAVAQVAAQRPAEAIAHASRALELDPQRADRLRQLMGNELLAEAYNERATALANRGDLRGAAVQYEAALKVRPDFDRALNNLGVVLMNLGETARAIQCFEEAVRRHPEYAEAQTNLEKARQVQASPVAPQ